MERTESHNAKGSEIPETTQTNSQQRELKKTSKLTTDQLKKYPGLSILSEAEAQQICETLFSLSVTFYELYSQIKSQKNELK